MCIRNLKYAHLTPIFWIHNIHLVFSTWSHKYKWILWTEKPVFNLSFQDFWCTNINNHLTCSVRNDKYVFIVFFEKIRCSNIQYTLKENDNTLIGLYFWLDLNNKSKFLLFDIFCNVLLNFKIRGWTILLIFVISENV